VATTKVKELDSALIESVCSRIRERLDPDDAPQAVEFVRQYYRRVPPEDLAELEPLDLYGAALAHRSFARRRDPGTPKLRVYNPEFEQHGWQSGHTVVELVSDDMPFLVDSATMELSGHGAGIHVLIHPVMRVRRNGDGELVAVLAPEAPAEEGTLAESFIHVEIDRHSGAAELERLRERLLDVLRQVAAAVEDWPAMRRRAADVIAELREPPPSLDRHECEEAAALLAWMDDGHFTFLGFREYELETQAGEDRLRPVAGSGLGILRESPGAKRSSGSTLTPRASTLAREPHPLVLTKANSRSTVHRPAYLDYVGVKRVGPDGDVVGERRFLGLYTTAAYRATAGEIPVLRRKVESVVARAAFQPASHAEKALVEILDTYPRDELFQIAEDELFQIAMGILAVGERQRVRLFTRRDAYERFVSCLVFLPRDRFHTRNRARIQEILAEAFDAESVDFELRLSESVLVRIHFTARVRPGRLPAYDAAEIEARIAEATGSWTDELQEALVEEAGEEQGIALYRRYGNAFPIGYREDWLARSAVADIRRIEQLAEDEQLAVSLYRPLEAPAGSLRCKLYRRGEPATLSEVLPMFESMGLQVRDERPYEIAPSDGPPTWIYDFGVEYGADCAIDVDEVRERFQDAFVRVWRGEVEHDGFNGLVLRAELAWRDVSVLRAVARYLRQARTAFSDRYMEQALSAHPRVAAALVELFRARFDPGRDRSPGAADGIARKIEEAIDAVESLDEDRILRNFLAVVRAMLRTNYFQLDAGGPKPYLSFKLDPARVPLVPAPRPRFEIFVQSPRVEGVHLRGGAVARGGLRWSDRREDFRTEILGLMKAQMVKNALIVPVGAKGGFVVKRPPPDREGLADEVVACYRTFISGLLDLTDTVRDGRVTAPPDLVRHHGDDPYLVVAADKGTATFSDIANGIAQEYGFWLGDAFASGGSVGYDHKAMGITARSAWESVKRHFRELGTDIQASDFTVVGIGDMSGDVFGNGMLLSPHIKLIGAFDHRHVFLDPDPDPPASCAERRRLFELPRSSWADYDRSLISEGGGVWPRTAKSITMSAEAQKALGIEADRLTPSELIRALLRAPVDLLWNGGIGTYVKATAESNADVGDKANDAVRVDAGQLRCRVVGEGGNLGFTQRGRVEYALGGGRINTDAIDNAGGVNCSDHEVNIKILLDAVVADGDLTAKQRNRLLADMTEAVAERVLRGSYLQTQALSLALAQAPAMVDVHDRMMRSLEQTGRLDRELEALPDAEAIDERRSGLTQPELAVLLAYSKITLYAALLDSDLPEDPALTVELAGYFPAPLPERFADRLPRHRLRREIVATRVTNSIVDRAGITFLFRLQEDTGAAPADIARAYAVGRDVFDMRGLWADVEALDLQVPATTQIAMLLEARRLVERATRWLLRSRPRPLDIGAELERFADAAAAVAEALPGVLVTDEREEYEARVGRLVDEGVPAELAGRVASLGDLFAALDIVGVASVTGRSMGEVASLHFLIGGRLDMHWLRDRIATLPRENRWQAMARAALRDDLFSLHAELTADVLRAGDAGKPPNAQALLDGWVDANRPLVERCLGILSDIRAGGTYDLTTLPVALRELRNLIQAAAAVAAVD
jgi:glutamate dehydrogenase